MIRNWKGLGLHTFLKGISPKINLIARLEFVNVCMCVCIYIVQETGVYSQVESYQRFKTGYLMLPCFTLSIIRYGSRVSRVIQGKE